MELAWKIYVLPGFAMPVRHRFHLAHNFSDPSAIVGQRPGSEQEKPWSEPYIPPNCDHNLCPINDFGPAIRKGCNIIPVPANTLCLMAGSGHKGDHFLDGSFRPAAFLRREILRHVLSFRQDVLSWINHARLRVWPVSFVCLCSDAGGRKDKYEH